MDSQQRADLYFGIVLAILVISIPTLLVGFIVGLL